MVKRRKSSGSWGGKKEPDHVCLCTAYQGISNLKETHKTISSLGLKSKGNIGRRIHDLNLCLRGGINTAM